MGCIELFDEESLLFLFLSFLHRLYDCIKVIQDGLFMKTFDAFKGGVGAGMLALTPHFVHLFYHHVRHNVRQR